MSASAISGLAVLRFSWVTPSSTNLAMNRLICKTTSGGANTTAGLTGLAAAGATWGNGAVMRALYDTATQLFSVEAQDLSPTGLATVINSGPFSSGTHAGQAASEVDTAVITLNTGLQGRAFRGRWYTVGPVADDLTSTGAAWDGTYVTAFATQLQALFTALAAAAPTPYTPVIWHKDGYGDPPINQDTVTPIISATGRIGLATQRRRRS